MRYYETFHHTYLLDELIGYGKAQSTQKEKIPRVYILRVKNKEKESCLHFDCLFTERCQRTCRISIFNATQITELNVRGNKIFMMEHTIEQYKSISHDTAYYIRSK